MPELPEVETIVRGLRKKIVREKVQAVKLLRRSLLEDGSIKNLDRALKGQTVNEICRRGKYIIITFSKGHTLVTHLRMTGKFIVSSDKSSPSRYCRMVITFENNTRLFYDDLRALGRLNLLKPGRQPKALEKLGPEPLEPDFTIAKLTENLSSIDREIKDALMDQKIIAGIGNIYAAEICFRARINPTRRTGRLTTKDIRTLHRAIVKIIDAAVNLHGTTFSDYRDIDGARGKFQKFLKIYGKQDQQCPRCSTPIRRIKQKQRSTCFCPKCQRT